MTILLPPSFTGEILVNFEFLTLDRITRQILYVFVAESERS